jgi:hypothetical protein
MWTLRCTERLRDSRVLTVDPLLPSLALMPVLVLAPAVALALGFVLVCAIVFEVALVLLSSFGEYGCEVVSVDLNSSMLGTMD